ncbi:MAG: putative Methyltransferase [Candidatus Saccharibacteria bacterium]|nr:putative Methyltransferase [Candidatus Saccharibacteria bacterium]
MNLRIIAGTFGGRTIASPDGTKTHPMSERVRNAMFNSLGEVVQGIAVLDAFAGTGALGIEAISRGATHATFIERDRIAQKVLAENVKLLKITEKTKIIKASVSSWIDTYDGPKFDLIFADPPYHDMQFSTVTKLMGLLKPGALMVLSRPGRSESPTVPGVVVVDNRGYGDAVLTYFRLDDKAE